MGDTRSINGIDRFDESLVANNTYTKPVATAKKSLANNLSDDSPENQENMKAIDQVQLALDIVGALPIPVVSEGADATNTLISIFRAALAEEKDERNKHILNAAISAISIIPFADVIKVLKLRKYPKLTKLIIKLVRKGRAAAKAAQAAGRFKTNSDKDKSPSKNIPQEGYIDPYAMAA